MVEWDEYTGWLESPEMVELRARVGGYLDKVHFKEGKKGDLLITIDRRPYKADLDRATADFQRAPSQTALARNDADRAGRLIETKAIYMGDFDTETRTYTLQRRLRRNPAQETLDSAQLNYEFTEIHAPMSGRIGRALVTEGNLVSGGLG